MGDWATITAEISPVSAVQPPLERRSQPPADSFENTTERKDKAEISAAGVEQLNRSQTEHSGLVREAPTDEKPGREPQEQKSNSNTQNDDSELTDEERREVAKLQARDREVRAHEQAHLAAASGMAVGGAHYEYEKGPDGKSYATGGEVQIAIRGGATPEERLRNAERAAQAALAPASPSSQDRAVAAEARAMAGEAQAEIAKETTAKIDDAGVSQAIAAYAEQDTETEIGGSIDVAA
jgi:hypothetical protein